MKYLKTYESMSVKGYKVGDYVYVISKYFQLENKPMIIAHIMKDENSDGQDLIILNYLDGEEFPGEFSENEIIIKLEDYEVEAEKYNL